MANAFEISTTSVRRVMADFKRDPHSLDQLPKEKGRPIYAMPDKLQSITREYIRTANQAGIFITQEKLRQYLIEQDSSLEIDIRPLGRALDRWGFTYGEGVRSQHCFGRLFKVRAY